MDTTFFVIILEAIALFCLIIFGAYLVAPRKTTRKIYKFDSSAIDALYDSNPEKFKKFICGEIVCKLNEVIDAVNELERGL